jgi:hypothetical protein
MALVYPILAQVLLTLVLAVALGLRRTRAVTTRQVRMRDVALSGDAYSVSIRKLGNNLQNQYETPVLFYVLCGVAIYLGVAGTLTTVLAWIYAASRLVHCAIHVTYNRVDHRFFAFATGVVVLVLMWLLLLFQLLAA